MTAVPATGSMLTARMVSVRASLRPTPESMPSSRKVTRSVPSQRNSGRFSGPPPPGEEMPPTKTSANVESIRAITSPAQACMAMVATIRAATIASEPT